MIEHLLFLALRTVLNRSWNELMLATREPADMQLARLLDILSRNKDTLFGREHGFAAIRSVKDYRDRVPVRTYDEFKSYITRMCLGEKGVLTSETPQLFGRTSGTTGAPKLIPVTPSFYEEFSKMQKMWQRKMVADYRSMLRGKILSSMSPEIEGYTESGIPYGAMSGHSYRLQYPITQMMYAVPYDVMCLRDFETKYYLILRFALEQEISAIAAMNPSTILLLMKKLNMYADRLARDIADGTIDSSLDIEPSLRGRLEERVRPNMKRAREISSLADRGTPLRGRDIWKSLMIIFTWQAGAAGFFLKDFPVYFPGVPVRDMGFIATEGYFSIPLWSNTPNGLLAITGHFFEFFGVRPDGSRDCTPIGCEELEAGKEYYIVVTTSGGLYRYDICDIIEVVDFYNKAPVIVFKQKGGNTISITGEKVTEIQVTDAMRAALDSVDIQVEGFVVTLKLDDLPSYVLAVEAAPEGEQFLPELLVRFESELRLRNIEYIAKRESQRLGAPLLWQLPQGFFEGIRKAKVRDGAPDGQYKIPHIVPSPDYFEGMHPTAEVAMPAKIS